MANRQQIVSTILKVAGNPENGVIKDLAGPIADAIVALDEPEVKSYDPVKETRVTKAQEKR